jgi:hypothetical protein
VENCTSNELLEFKLSETWKTTLNYQSLPLFRNNLIEFKNNKMIPEKLFISYSHIDEDIKKRFEQGLGVLKRLKKVDIWQDRELLAGKDFDKDIFQNLNSSKIICILVSPAFVNSDYCYSKEMEKALERHNKGECFLVPIIIRPTPNWHDLPFAKITSLPRDGKPVTEWENVDKAWENVVSEINRLLKFIESNS